MVVPVPRRPRLRTALAKRCEHRADRSEPFHPSTRLRTISALCSWRAMSSRATGWCGMAKYAGHRVSDGAASSTIRTATPFASPRRKPARRDDMNVHGLRRGPSSRDRQRSTCRVTLRVDRAAPFPRHRAQTFRHAIERAYPTTEATPSVPRSSKMRRKRRFGRSISRRGLGRGRFPRRMLTPPQALGRRGRRTQGQSR